MYVRSEVNAKGKSETKIDFQSIDRKEFDIFQRFLEEKKITIQVNQDDVVGHQHEEDYEDSSNMSVSDDVNYILLLTLNIFNDVIFK